MTATEILKQAQLQADAQPRRVFDQLFDQAKYQHVHHDGNRSIGCSCSYCCALHDYTHQKITALRLRRNAERYDEENSGWEWHWLNSQNHREVKNQFLRDSIL